MSGWGLCSTLPTILSPLAAAVLSMIRLANDECRSWTLALLVVAVALTSAFSLLRLFAEEWKAQEGHRGRRLMWSGLWGKLPEPRGELTRGAKRRCPLFVFWVVMGVIVGLAAFSGGWYWGIKPGCVLEPEG